MFEDEEQIILRELPEDVPSGISSPISGDAAAQEHSTPDEDFTPPPSAAEASAEDSSEDEAGQLPLLGHLRELRKRLIRILIIVFIGFFALFGISEEIYAFIAKPLIENLPAGSSMIYTKPHGAFFTYMKVSLMCSVFLTCPLTFYQIWAFIAPGLYKEEKRYLLPLTVLSALFFISGSAFCYCMVFPIAFQFFMGFGTDVIVPMISVEEYLDFVLKLLLAFGLVFEMPLFSFFLAKMGIIGPEGMRRWRKYAVLAIFVAAAILTPPDVFSQILMALPMLLLYEISIFVAAAASSKNKKASAEEDGDDSSSENETEKTGQSA